VPTPATIQGTAACRRPRPAAGRCRPRRSKASSTGRVPQPTGKEPVGHAQEHHRRDSPASEPQAEQPLDPPDRPDQPGIQREARGQEAAGQQQDAGDEREAPLPAGKVEPMAHEAEHQTEEHVGEDPSSMVGGPAPPAGQEGDHQRAAHAGAVQTASEPEDEGGKVFHGRPVRRGRISARAAGSPPPPRRKSRMPPDPIGRGPSRARA